MKFRSAPFVLLFAVFWTISNFGITGEKHALLVGVSEYPKLEKEMWLSGPVHDCELVSSVLINRLKFKAERITTLSGWPEETANRPTRANIENAFKKLATQVNEGDTAFILMSGHGSQQPANPDPSDLEPDGLDEIFLPADTSEWDERTKTVQGAILDDEIHLWVDAIRAKGASVWIIFDSCHSGTMTRGTTHSGRINRRIPPETLIPTAPLESASLKTRGNFVLETRSDLDDDSQESSPENRGKLIAMYAAQSLEPTFEMPMPPPLGDHHGLFTFTLMQILNQAPKVLTYRDLAETVSIIYRGNGIFQPTPLIEGDGLDQLVMGNKELKGRPSIAFTGMAASPTQFEINAGLLTGLREGTVVEVYPPALAPDSEKPIGTAKVVKASATQALVTPENWGSLKAVDPAKIGAGCRAMIVFEKLALDKMRVAIQISNADEIETIAAKDLPEVEARLIKSARPSGSPWVWADTLEKADWILRISDVGTRLIPMAGWSKANGAENPPEFQAGTSKEIISSLRRIAKARQLLHIASGNSKSRDVDMEVTLVRFAGSVDTKGTPVKHGENGRILRGGEEIAFQIRNRGTTSIDVSLLFVDGSFGVTALFPEPGTIDDNRIPPGKTLVTPRLEVTAETSGPEQVVALGIRSTRDRVDFSCLEQNSLERTRSLPALASPLGELLKDSLFGEGNTRGLARSKSSDHATRLITWRTEVE